MGRLYPFYVNRVFMLVCYLGFAYKYLVPIYFDDEVIFGCAWYVDILGM